jgi:hypothetical protein
MWTNSYWNDLGATGDYGILQVGGSTLMDEFQTYTLSFGHSLSKRTVQ